jgi:predicted phosphoribosyltransferase
MGRVASKSKQTKRLPDTASAKLYFGTVGTWYEDFSQTTDEEVCDLLERAAVGTMVATQER